MSQRKYITPITTSLRIDKAFTQFAHQIRVELGEIFITGLLTHVENEVDEGRLSVEALEELNHIINTVIISQESKIKYAGFIHTPEYKAWAGAVKHRDGMKCQACGSSKRVEAHHKRSVVTHPELKLDLSNGITLCRSCHRSIHAEAMDQAMERKVWGEG